MKAGVATYKVHGTASYNTTAHKSSLSSECVYVKYINTNRCSSTAADIHSGPVLRELTCWQCIGIYERLVWRIVQSTLVLRGVKSRMRRNETAYWAHSMGP